MNANVIIKKASDGTTRLNAQIGVGSKRNYMLMEHDYLTLKFSTDTPTLLHLGDYVEIENVGRYELTAPTRGELNKSTGGYDYEIRLDAQYWKFKNKLCKFLPQIGSNETSWTYTDTLANHAQQILFNIRALAYKRDDDGKETLMADRKNFLYNGKTDWSIEWDDSVDATKAVTIQYDSKNIIDAIAEIAEAYECEWWFEQNVLHFGKCEYGTTPVKLEMGDELVAISRSDSKETYATRIYAYGSDRNIASNYRKALVFDASVSNGLLHDPARELEVRYFRASDTGIRKGKADTQCVLDFAPVSALERNFEYRTNTASETGVQSGAFHLFKPDGHTGDEYDFDMTGERKSMKSGMFEWSWLPMEKPYLVLSTFRLTVTPTALNKVTDAITPKYLTAFFRLIVDYYDKDGQTKRTAYHTIMTKGAWQGVNKPIEFKFEDQYLAIPTEKVERVVIENGSQIDFAIWYDESGNNYGYVYDNSPTISVKIDATGQIGLFEGWPEFSAAGITIEVLDKTTGEVDHTITGATFNAGFDKSQRKLTLPSGASISNGDKYHLPQLNTAMVPARYFTSIYTVFEKYQDVTTNGIVNSRLLLPEVDEDGNPIKGYLDAFDFESEEEAVEDVVIFEDVYPSRISKITSIQLSDEYTEEQPEQDGSKTQINYREFIFTDDLFSDANKFNRGDYLIDGAALQVTFQSGLLNGMTFDVELLEDNYHFQIKRDDTTKLPNEIIKPKTGDEFILHGFNIAMISDSKTDYVSSAEKELLRKTREYIEKLNTDTSTYQCTVGSDLAYEVEEDSPDGLYLGIGRSVNLIHPGYFKNGRISRVLGYEIPLDFAYDNPVYFVGEKAKYSRIGAIEDRLDGIGNTTGNFGAVLGGGGTAGTGSGGASPYVIQQIDSTPPTDRNVYSALRARLEFALKTIAQTIKHVWTFLKGIRIGTFIAGQSGAQIDAAGNAEVESLHVRSWLKVQELIYNRLNAQEGDTSFGDVGTIEQITNNSDGTQTALMRMRWEGDFTAFQPGDVVYGYVNKLDRADAKEYYKAWAWVKSVDRAANQLVLATYPDTETPAGKNHPMTEGMVISRWGNNIEPSLQTYINPAYSAVIGKRGDTYINKRQRTFFISCDSGNLVELMGVNKPKLEPGNYGTILGIIPDGLLDEKTEELVNKDQPYLFARGIIVQDLIRVGYEGVTTRTANYRGIWSSQTAASTTDYYRSTPGMYDTVTWNGALWQCVASKTLDEPKDSSAAWVKMTASLDDGKEIKLWFLNPSANIVSVRRTEVRPEVLTCSVTLCSSDNSTRTFENNYDLLQAGAKLFYSADGVTWQEFIIGQTEPLDLEDESGVIEMENSTNNSSVLTVGGNDINTADIGDRIIFKLTAADDTTEVLALTHVPVVKDGERAPFQSTVFMRTNTQPATPTGGTYESPIPTSTPTWSDSIPEGEQMLWASTRTFDDKQTTAWETPRQMTDTATYDVEFSDIDQNPGTPATDPTKWFDPDKDKATKDFTKMLWRAERQKKNGTWSDWTIVRIKGEKGEDGATGDWTSYVFKQSDTKPATPTDKQHTIPTGWQDAPSATGKWWMSKALISGVTQKPGTWSEPVQCTAEDGKPGQYTDFKYKSHIKGQSPALLDSTARHPNGWSDTPPTLFVGYDLWMTQAEIDHDNNVIGQWSTPTRISGEKGEQGEPGEDGQDGIDGRDGLMVYPAGYYDPNTTYTATSETAPVVMYAENYYVLKRGKSYKGASQASNLNTPALDIANNTQANAHWQRFDKFNAIFADIVMAEFAKLGSAVIYGDWMISQQGTRNATASSEYQHFKDGSFEPNVAINFKTGELRLKNGVLANFAKLGSAVFYGDWMISQQGALTQNGTTDFASTQYSHFADGSFIPNVAINFKTGEMRTRGTFNGFISRTPFVITPSNIDAYTIKRTTPTNIPPGVNLDWRTLRLDLVGTRIRFEGNFASSNISLYLPAITNSQDGTYTAAEIEEARGYIGNIIVMENDSNTHFVAIGNRSGSMNVPVGSIVQFECKMARGEGSGETTDLKEYIEWESLPSFKRTPKS